MPKIGQPVKTKTPDRTPSTSSSGSRLPLPTGVSPWKRHVTEWENCDRCDLCSQRRRVVLLRGRVPCHVLFVGEAPGESEDVVGQPFVGPAGKLFSECVEQAMPSGGGLTVAFTNLVGCYPREAKDAGVNEPPVEAIKACGDRLRQVVELCKPQLIVCVGALSAKWTRKLVDTEGIKLLDVVHPAFILRMPVSHQGLKAQETIVRLSTAIEELVPF